MTPPSLLLRLSDPITLPVIEARHFLHLGELPAKPLIQRPPCWSGVNVALQAITICHVAAVFQDHAPRAFALVFFARLEEFHVCFPSVERPGVVLDDEIVRTWRTSTDNNAAGLP